MGSQAWVFGCPFFFKSKRRVIFFSESLDAGFPDRHGSLGLGLSMILFAGIGIQQTSLVLSKKMRTGLTHIILEM
jgi:hypothetical protein